MNATLPFWSVFAVEATAWSAGEPPGQQESQYALVATPPQAPPSPLPVPSPSPLATYEPALASSQNNPLWKLNNFGIHFTLYFQSQGSSGSALFLWSPAFHPLDRLKLHADLGLTFLNTRDIEFLVVHAQLRASYRVFSEFSAEAMFGIQNWTWHAGTFFSAGVGLGYRLQIDTLPEANAVRISFNHVARTGFPTWQLTAGVEFSLGTGGVSQVIDPLPPKERASNPLPQSTPSAIPMPLPTPSPSIVPEPVERPPTPSSFLKKEGEKIKITLSSSKLSFGTGTATISSSSMRYLENIARAFAQFGDKWKSLHIVGHTDSKGIPSRNRKLSERRARAVAALFERAGIQPSRLRLKGAGSSVPVAANDNENGRRQNRRVEIDLDPSDQDLAEFAKVLREIDQNSEGSPSPDP